MMSPITILTFHIFGPMRNYFIEEFDRIYRSSRFFLSLLAVQMFFDHPSSPFSEAISRLTGEKEKKQSLFKFFLPVEHRTVCASCAQSFKVLLSCPKNFGENFRLRTYFLFIFLLCLMIILILSLTGIIVNLTLFGAWIFRIFSSRRLFYFLSLFKMDPIRVLQRTLLWLIEKSWCLLRLHFLNL